MATSTQDSSGERGLSGAARFGQTHWSMVLAAAGKKDVAQAAQSLEELCRVYWLPLYTFIRRQGENAHDAQDLTQQFFACLLAKDYLSAVDPGKGRFRSFLLASLKHFLANQRDHARAQKRGGGRAMLSLNFSDADTHGGYQPADNETPEKAFDRRWALTLLEQALDRLRREHVERGRERLFEQLKATLTEGRSAVAYAELSARLGMSEAAVKMSVLRLRQRYREVLREEIAETVAVEGEVEDELRQIMRALCG